MAGKRYQYEPLVTPAKWWGDERRFSMRLTQILDDLYAKVGRLEEQIKNETNVASNDPEE